jgi:glycosyltransferase involved in cell wall biosynthesis
MSNTLLEAMATGLPIVATDVGSNRELLDDGRCGFVVPPDAGSLTTALKTILSDRQAALRMGEIARARVAADFDLATMVRRYEDFYERILEGRPERRP